MISVPIRVMTPYYANNSIAFTKQQSYIWIHLHLSAIGVKRIFKKQRFKTF